jgi:hypothetical protein
MRVILAFLIVIINERNDTVFSRGISGLSDCVMSLPAFHNFWTQKDFQKLCLLYKHKYKHVMPWPQYIYSSDKY